MAGGWLVATAASLAVSTGKVMMRPAHANEHMCHGVDERWHSGLNGQKQV